MCEGDNKRRTIFELAPRVLQSIILLSQMQPTKLTVKERFVDIRLIKNATKGVRHTSADADADADVDSGAVIPPVLPWQEVQQQDERCPVAKIGHSLTWWSKKIKDIVSDPLNDNEWDFEELSSCLDDINQLRETMLGAITRRSSKHRLAVERSANLEACLERKRREGHPTPLTTWAGATLFMADEFAVPEIPLSRDGWTIVLRFMGQKSRAALCRVSKACCAAVMYDVKELNIEVSGEQVQACEQCQMNYDAWSSRITNLRLLTPNCRRFNVTIRPAHFWGDFLKENMIFTYLEISLRRIYGLSGVSLVLTYNDGGRPYNLGIVPSADLFYAKMKIAWRLLMQTLGTPDNRILPFEALVVNNFGNAQTFLSLENCIGGADGSLARNLIIDITSGYGRALPLERHSPAARVSKLTKDLLVFITERIADKLELALVFSSAMETSGGCTEQEDEPGADPRLDYRGTSGSVALEVNLATSLTEYVDMRVGDPRGCRPEEWMRMERQRSLWGEPEVVPRPIKVKPKHAAASGPLQDLD